MNPERLRRSETLTEASQANEAGEVLSWPVIHLPNYVSRSNMCNGCGWNGEPDEFLKQTEQFSASGRAQRNLRVYNFKCPCCRLGWNICINRDAIYQSSSEYIRDESSQAVQVFTTLDIDGTPFECWRIRRCNLTRMESLFQESSQWAQSHISECLAAHQSCRLMQRDVSFTPLRLINVSPRGLGEDVVLEDDIPPGSDYVALSYCWGDYEPECTTTRDTVNKNMQRISWSTLPATFQDAVMFTRSLNIKYLWIDNICIIQRDTEDWGHQAGQMFHIYKNAYVTLAGLYGRSSASGLRAISIEGQSMKVAEISLSKFHLPIYTRRFHYFHDLKMAHPTDSIADISKWGPLLCRAWAYQERMISPRILYFTESEIIFQCFQNIACECGTIKRIEKSPKSIFLDNVFHAKKKYGQGVSMSTEERNPNYKRQRDKIANIWRGDIVSFYSGLVLTNGSDKLPGIGAMAELFQQARPGESYLAGLWSGTFLQDLLWSCPVLIGGVQQRNALNRLNSLPTWSWASLQTTVFSNQYSFDNWLPLAEILEIRCDYKEGNSFGILEGSLLILRGRLLLCKAEWIGPKFVRLFLSGRRELLWSTWTYMDHDGIGYQCIPQQQKVYLLAMGKSHYPYYGETRAYLILRREEGINIFSRIGTVLNPQYGMTKDEDEDEDEKKKLGEIIEEESVMTDCEIR
ncbi:HET-domain-containing protein [Hypoxylon sp. EC38]|nr:HET-domain-containing protein [Hypoxylon sp. EC38]